MPTAEQLASVPNALMQTNLHKHAWKCTFCGETSVDEAHLASADPLEYAELCDEAVEYVHPAPGPQVSGVDVRPHVVVVVDATLEEGGLLGPLRRALPEAMAACLTPDMLVSVVAVDSCVSVLSLAAASSGAKGGQEEGGEEGAQLSSVPAQVISGAHAMDQAGVALLAAPHAAYWAEMGALGGAGGALERALCSLRPLHTEQPQRVRPRCLAVGVEAALRLLAAAAGHEALTRPHPLPDTSRVLVFAGGPITKGPGSVPLELVDGTERGSKEGVKAAEEAREHCTALARMAASLGVGIDIMLGGELAANVPLLSLLAKHSAGGEVWGSASWGSPLLPTALRSALCRRFATSAQLDAHASTGVKLINWLGPVEVLEDGGGRGAGETGASMRQLSPNACSVAGGLQVGRGVAARFELSRDIDQSATPFVYIQLLLQYTELGTGRRIQRVTTRRLPVVTTAAEFIRSINPSLAAVVSAKRLVADARRGQMMSAKGGVRDAGSVRKAEEAARGGASAQVALVAARCGREVAVSRGIFGSRKARLWPAPLMPLAHALYQLQRGRALGGLGSLGGSCHPDERALTQAAMLCAASGGALPLVAPALYALMPVQAGAHHGHEPGAGEQISLTLAPLPCLNIIVRACAGPQAHSGNDTPTSPPASPLPIPPLLCDAGDTLLLLPPPPSMRNHASAPTLDACIEAALSLAAGRFPTPLLHIVGSDGEEGVDLEVLESLCEPAHTDAWPDQAAQLAGMAAAAADPHVAASSLAHLIVGGEAGCKAWSAQLRVGSSGGQEAQTLSQWVRSLGVELLPPR